MGRSLIATAFLLFLPMLVVGQDDKVDEVTDRAGDKAEQRVDRKIDEGIEHSLDKLEGVFFGGKKKKERNKSEEEIAPATTPESSTTKTDDVSRQVTIEENNSVYEPLGFTGSYRMEVHSYKNGKEDKDSPSSIGMAFTDDRMVMIPEAKDQKGEMRMIHDLKNKVTYTLITDEKGQRTGIKMKMMSIQYESEEDDTENAGKVTRTDEIRTIEGHSCRRYTFVDEDGNGEAWIAEDLDFNMMKAFARLSGNGQAAQWQQVPYSGVMMESTWNDPNGKEKVTMFTRDLVIGTVDDNLFSTSGYQIQDMTSMPMYGR